MLRFAASVTDGEPDQHPNAADAARRFCRRAPHSEELLEKVGALPASDAGTDVVAAADDLRDELATMGISVGRPWLG